MVEFQNYEDGPAPKSAEAAKTSNLAASPEVVGNKSGQPSSDYARSTLTALKTITNLFDSGNPVQIVDSSKANDKSANGSARNIDYKHNAEIAGILLHAEAILSQDFRDPIDSNARVSQRGAEQPDKIKTGEARTARNVTDAAQKAAPNPEQTVQARQMEAASQSERQLRARQVQAELEGLMLASGDAQLEKKDLPVVTSAEDAKKHLEYARQNDMKAVIDFKVDGCKYCDNMDKYCYPALDPSKVLVINVNAGRLNESVQEFCGEIGVTGNITGYPYTAVYGPGNDYKQAQNEKGGEMQVKNFLAFVAAAY